MPAVAKDGMRGLAVFISDIRNCKSKEAETKRINKVSISISRYLTISIFVKISTEPTSFANISVDRVFVKISVNWIFVNISVDLNSVKILDFSIKFRARIKIFFLRN